MPDEDGQHANRMGVSPEGGPAETRSGAEVPRGGPVEDDRPDPRPSAGGVVPRRVLIAATHEDLSEHLKAINERISARSHDSALTELAEILDGDAPDDAPGQTGVADADIFMAIVAWRYGAIPPEHDRSIIQSAYEEVVRQGKPHLIFLAAPGTEYQTDVRALFPAAVRDEQNLRSLHSLRALLERERGVAYFTSPEDLAAKVDAALRGMLDLASDAPHDAANLGAALNNLGDLAVEARQWEDAERYDNDAVGIFSETSAPSSAAAVLLRLGRLAHAHRSNETEFAAYTRALGALRQLDDQPTLAFVLRRLGALALTGGKKKQAAQYCDESLALHRELRDRRGIAITLSCLGTLNARNKRFADAIAHCTASLSLFEALQLDDYAQTARLDLVELEAALEVAQADPSGAAPASSPTGSASAVAANEWGEHDDEDGEGGSESGETLSADDVAPERRQQLMADFERNTDLGKPPYARTIFIMPQEIEWVIGERGWGGWNNAVDLRNAVFAGLRLTDMKFEDADLAGADLSRSDLSEVIRSTPICEGQT